MTALRVDVEAGHCAASTHDNAGELRRPEAARAALHACAAPPALALTLSSPAPAPFLCPLATRPLHSLSCLPPSVQQGPWQDGCQVWRAISWRELEEGGLVALVSASLQPHGRVAGAQVS